MTAALLIEAGTQTTQPLQRASLEGGHDEKWLQALIFEHPHLIPIDRIDPGAGQLIPVCREFALPKEGSTVFLDLLGVTPQGRLVLIECKLWRNPQARREVVAQILEYAALLRRWSYADLTARLKTILRAAAANPLFEQVSHQVSELNETRFVDAVAASLKTGDFDLIIAGDGIRSDLEAIAGHLDARGGLAARLALVEFQLWTDPTGRTLVVPALAMRTEVIRHRVILGIDGQPLSLEEARETAEEAEAIIDPERVAQKAGNRAFWQRFIDTVRFDHPDQPPPRHGGNNWVKIPLPAPVGSMTAYRTQNEAGLFVRLSGDEGKLIYQELEEAAVSLREETKLDIRFTVEKEEPFQGRIGVTWSFPRGLLPPDDDQLDWLSATANNFVGCFRSRILPYQGSKLPIHRPSGQEVLW